MLIPQLQYIHKVVDVFVVLVVLVPQLQVVEKTAGIVEVVDFFVVQVVLDPQAQEAIEIPQLQILDNVVDMPGVCNDGCPWSDRALCAEARGDSTVADCGVRC